MRKTLASLQALKKQKTPIACITAYDATFAHWASEKGADVILVGDSLGMVVQGHDTTLPVTLEEMQYHLQMVQRGNQMAWCIADLPFMTDATLESCLQASASLMKAGANMVKLEGGERVVQMVRELSQLGVPVCGHLGLLPQSVQKKGYRVQGKDEASAQHLIKEALLLQDAGIDMLILECVPQLLAAEISAMLAIPVIGIGSGAACDGQVLVITDLLGITPGKMPSFSKNFMQGADSIPQAIERYVQAVKKAEFPAQEHVIA